MKNKIIIRRIQQNEIDELKTFFATVLIDTFRKNNIMELEALLTSEIEDKERCVQEDLKANNQSSFFLVGEYNNEIIASIAIGPTNDVLNECSNNKYKDHFEMNTVFIHPKYQGKGLLKLMLIAMFEELQKRQVDEVCFDSGYKTAQAIWIKKFEEPEFCERNYWGQDAHHMVWGINVSKELNKLKKNEWSFPLDGIKNYFE